MPIKKYLFLLTLLGACLLASAQQDTTTIYSRTVFERDPVRSQFNKKVVKQDSLWVVALTDNKGALQEKISFADEKLEVRFGPYIRYQHGQVVQEGRYSKGYQVGEWKTYHQNKQLAVSANYVWGKLHGDFKKYWANGQLKQQTYFRHGQPMGISSMFYANGKIAAQEIYDQNGLVSTSYFDSEGKSIIQKVVLPDH